MSNEFQMILNILVTTLPIRFLAYFPFAGKLRCKKLTLGIVIALSELIFCVVGVFSLQLNLHPKISELITAIICFALYWGCINIKIYKLIFFYLFLTEYTMIVRGIAVFISNFLPSEMSSVYYSWQNSFIFLVIVMITMPFMIMFFIRTAERIIETDDWLLWKTIWLVPALTIFIVLLFTGSLSQEITEEPIFLIARICLLICTFVVYYILLFSLDILREHATLEERAKQAEAINDLHKSQYNLMQKRIEETKIARHDLRQHLNLIQAYLDSGERKALENYLKAYKKSLPTDTTQIYCSNYTVDVVVRYYAEQSKLSGISFYAKLMLPKQISVEEPDVCVIFGNLLENALEACKRQNEGEKFIRVCARIIGTNAISITIDNSSNQKPNSVDKAFISSKREEIGTGILSVNNIADKYNGVTNFTYDNGIFFASVLLNPD